MTFHEHGLADRDGRAVMLKPANHLASVHGLLILKTDLEPLPDRLYQAIHDALHDEQAK